VTYASFLADPAAVRDRGEWLCELYLKNPSGVEEILRFSRRGTATGLAAITIGSDTIPANTLFRKRVLKAPSLQQALWREAGILGASLPAFGAGSLSNRDGGLDQYRPVEGYQWAGCRCKWFLCDKDDIQGTIGKVFDGQLDSPRFGLKIPVEVPLRGREALFEEKLSERVFRGSSYWLELFGDRTVSYGAPAAVALTGSFTIEGWLWLDAMPTGGPGYYGWFTGTKPWTLLINSTGTFTLQGTFAGVTEARTSVAAMAVQKPYHWAISVAGATPTLLLWDDDAQTLTTEALAPFSGATRDAAAGGTQFWLRSAINATFKPWSDQMRVWNVARTAAEIAGDRFRPFVAGSVPTACVHCAALQDGTGTTVTDLSATAANGTISGPGTSAWIPSMEGGPDMAGSPKQDVCGRNFGVPAVLVDAVRNGYMVAGGGAVSSIASFEGGLGHTMAAAAASYRAYATTTPAAGQALPYPARGLFRLGLSPTLPVAATVLGYNGGPLGYVETVAGVIRDIVTRRGPKLADPAGLDTASFTALAATAPSVVGAVFPEPVTIREALDFFASGAQTSWGYARASTLFRVARFTGPSGTADHSFDQRHIIDITEAPATPVVYQVIVRYQRSLTVLSEDQVAASVKGTAAWQRWTKEWLETPPQTDDAIRAAHPGSASVSLTFDTPLYHEAAANALAVSLLAILKGAHEPLLVTMRAPGFELTPGETLALGMTMQDGTVRLGLDGTRRFVLNSIEDNRQEGTVTAEVWR
jgi:hypothetical protein